MPEDTIIQETNHITRIHMSSGAIRTCAFLIDEETDYTVIDSGLDEHTVCNQLLPALRQLGISLDRISRLLLTHSHFDHIGGLHWLTESLPCAEIYAHQSISQHSLALYDGMMIGSLQAVSLPGHTADCFGFLDVRTSSLISGDAIQLWGIERFGVYAEEPDEYLNSHEKLLSMPIGNIFSSHAYDFCGIRAIGTAASRVYVQESKRDYETLIAFVRKWYGRGRNAEQICGLFEDAHPDYPKMQSGAISRIIQAFCL